MSPVDRGRTAKVALAVLLVKAYALIFLYVHFLEGHFKEDYSAFLALKKGQTREERLAEIKGSFVERLAPYDGQFYLDIAASGYRRFEYTWKSRQLAMAQGNYAFFPLLPGLLRVFSGNESRLGLAVILILSTLLSTGALVGVWVLARKLGVPPWLTLGFILSYPGAAFQSALYTESFFLALSVGVALASYAEKNRLAALLGYLGGLCRPQGVLLSGLSLARQRSGGKVAMRMIAVLAPPAGVATFAVFLYFAISSPLGFVEIQRDWGREFALGRPLGEFFGLAGYQGPPLDRLGVLLGVGLLPFLWRRLPRPLALYGTVSVLLPLLSGSILSFGRFSSVSFPHFLCLAKLLERWKVASLVLLGAFAAFQTILSKGLIAWHFVG
jgi:hypothetical protein